jgi:hypothetical protein
MQSNYRIGTLAEKIVAVKITLDGTITPIFRQREPKGRMIDIPHHNYRRANQVVRTEFVARVAAGHSGVVTMALPRWGWIYSAGVIPLGPSDAFADDEIPTNPGNIPIESVVAPASANPDEVWFQFADGRLSWKSENVSGSAVINPTYPEIAVVLRLPPGNQGEISFASPLFTTADGEPAAVLSVA